MRHLGKWRLWWWLLFACSTAVGLSFAQSSQNPQTTRGTAGRFVIYYHPTNFNQALLLDTSTGAVWELAVAKYKSAAKGKEGEEVEFRVFQRVGVEGTYKSAAERIQESQFIAEGVERLRQQKTEIDRQRKLKQAEEVERLRQEREQEDRQQKLRESIPRVEELREIFRESQRFPLKLRDPANVPLQLRNLFNDRWPQFQEFIREFGFDGLMREIRKKYPQLATEFPTLFEESRE